MLRHTTFAMLSLFACSVASAQYPVMPFGTFGAPRVSPAYQAPGGSYGIQRGGCVGGNCPTGNCPNGNCPNGNCPNGNCATGSCATGNCGTGGMICGPNGCYAPGTASGSYNPYLPRPPLGGWTPTNGNYRIQPYPLPSSTYPGYPNIPSAYRNRSLPMTGRYPLFGTPGTGGIQFYPPVTGATDPYDAYSGPGVLH